MTSIMLRGSDLGNYEYVSRQNVASNIIVTTGTITEGTTDEIERTIPNGKTAYILNVKVVPDTLITPGTHDYQGIFDLQVNAVVVDMTHIGSRGQIGGATNADNANTVDGQLGNGIFDVEGADKLVGDGAKKLGVHVSSATAAKTFFVRMVTLEVTSDSELIL
jgi:hypothetical protein